MHVRLRDLLRRQGGLVAGWQLVGLHWSRAAIDHAVARGSWQIVHPGVYAVSPARLSRWQRWRAGTLSHPATYLAGPCAAASYGFRPDRGALITVVRHGSGGPRRQGSLVISHSSRLTGHTTEHKGIPTVTAPRALVDIASGLGPRQLGTAFRESIRLRTTTANEIAQALRALRGRRGTACLRELCDRYATIPYHRCRSDPEGFALEVLHDAGVRMPEVNVEVAGREADLVWRDARLIIELDSREFHQFTDQDRVKESRWASAGYTVRRLPGPTLYDDPQRLLAETNVHLTHP